MDDHTKKQVLDAEDEVHAGHQHWEQWKEKHMPTKGSIALLRWSAYILWKLSDMYAGTREVGKELRLGTSWGGVIELSDAMAMARLIQYFS